MSNLLALNSVGVYLLNCFLNNASFKSDEELLIIFYDVFCRFLNDLFTYVAIFIQLNLIRLYVIL